MLIPKKVNIYGAIAAFILGPKIMISAHFFKVIAPWTFSTVGVAVCLIIGYSVSLFTPKSAPEKRNTVYGIKT